jgi:hypothetical protein
MKFHLPFNKGKLWIVRDPGQGNALFQSRLFVKHFREGGLLEERDLGTGVVTNAGVNLWAGDWNNGTATIKLATWHDSGTGVTAPTVSDVFMQTPTGNARIIGAQSNLNNVYKTIATLAYGGSFAITEWGLFTAVTSGTMFDHRTFSVINCVSGDTIQFTYQLTLVSGG